MLDHMDVCVELLNVYRRTDICVSTELLKKMDSHSDICVAGHTDVCVGSYGCMCWIILIYMSNYSIHIGLQMYVLVQTYSKEVDRHTDRCVRSYARMRRATQCIQVYRYMRSYGTTQKSRWTLE